MKAIHVPFGGACIDLFWAALTKLVLGAEYIRVSYQKLMTEARKPREPFRPYSAPALAAYSMAGRPIQERHDIDAKHAPAKATGRG